MKKKRDINEVRENIISSNKYVINSSDERMYNQIGNLLESYGMEKEIWKRSQKKKVMQFQRFIGKVKSGFCRTQDGFSVMRFQRVGPTQPVQLTEEN